MDNFNSRHELDKDDSALTFDDGRGSDNAVLMRVSDGEVVARGIKNCWAYLEAHPGVFVIYTELSFMRYVRELDKSDSGRELDNVASSPWRFPDRERLLHLAKAIMVVSPRVVSSYRRRDLLDPRRDTEIEETVIKRGPNKGTKKTKIITSKTDYNDALTLRELVLRGGKAFQKLRPDKHYRPNQVDADIEAIRDMFNRARYSDYVDFGDDKPKIPWEAVFRRAASMAIERGYGKRRFLRLICGMHQRGRKSLIRSNIFWWWAGFNGVKASKATAEVRKARWREIENTLKRLYDEELDKRDSGRKLDNCHSGPRQTMEEA